MTLLNTILRKVTSQESVTRKYTSPPPELNDDLIKPKKKKRALKGERYYSSVHTYVDSSPPRLDPSRMRRKLVQWARQASRLQAENMDLLTRIRQMSLMGGRVDSRWQRLPPLSTQYFESRVDFLKRVQNENTHLYKLIMNTNARVVTTKTLRRDWARNRHDIVAKALYKFVLFPEIPQEDIEDLTFMAPAGVRRPRVYLTLRIRGGATIGELAVELFTDVCPLTCQLFTELVQGDDVGFGYVGTCFFT